MKLLALYIIFWPQTQTLHGPLMPSLTHFFCFTALMSEIMNNFCKTLDSSEMGIRGQIRDLNLLLKKKDPALWWHLESVQLDPQFYSFRWLTLLLSQEFELPDVIRLWDTLFSDKNRFRHLLNVCIAMLIIKRDDLLSYDFAGCLKLLQKYPPVDMNILLYLADEVACADYRASDFVIPGEGKPQKEVDLGNVISVINTAWSSLVSFGSK